MSVPATGGVPSQGAGEVEKVEIPRSGDAAFAGLMDALAPEPDEGSAAAAPGEAGAGAGAAAPGAAGAAGTPDAAGDGAAGRPTAGDGTGAGSQQPAAGGAAGSDAGGAAAGDGGAAGPDGGDPADAAAAGGGTDQQRAAVTLSSADLAPKLGELSTKLEETTSQAYQAAALEEVRGEYTKYFEALNQHPRLMVGMEVPAIGKEGTERLRDTNDAREWQEAVKSILVAEVRDRAGRAMEENRDFLQTVHASIDLFKNNADLIPNTKEFDRELADEFAKMAKPYELRVDGKLQGYSIPVQPIIDNLRTQLSSRRAAQTAPPAGTQSASPPAAGGAPAAPAPADPPQAGITSKAGNSGEKEDFSTLFGTIGLPNLQI